MTWGPEALSRKLRTSRIPVSAFFLVDSEEAVDRCARAMAALLDRDPDDPGDAAFFERVRKIRAKGKNVRNVDHAFTVLHDGETWDLLLRIHSIEPGRYEAELQIPGILAASREGRFGTGQDGRFFCAFMPHSFYD